MSKEQKSLELVVSLVNDKFGEGSIIRLGDDKPLLWPSLPTGALTLDLILGIGGLPRGRIVELFGAESAGKTTLALSMVVEAQKLGYQCLYIDAEHALDPTYMKNIGIDFNKLFIAQPLSGENAIDIATMAVKSGEVGLVVIDSVPGLIPQAVLDGDMNDNHIARLPRLMADAMKHLTGPAFTTKTLILFINQIREKPGIMYGSPETQPGGRSLKFQASIRMDVRRVKEITNSDGEITGVRVKVKTVKNKMAAPLKICEFDIIFDKGIDNIGCIADAAVDNNLIQKAGAWYKYEGQSFQGRDNLINYLSENIEIAELLRKKILGDD